MRNIFLTPSIMHKYTKLNMIKTNNNADDDVNLRIKVDREQSGVFITIDDLLSQVESTLVTNTRSPRLKDFSLKP